MSTSRSSYDGAMVAPVGPRSGTTVRRARRPRRLAALVLAITLVAGGCGVGRAPNDASEDPPPTSPDGLTPGARQSEFLEVTWDRLDERLRRRVVEQALDGAALVVESADDEPRRLVVGWDDLDQPLPLAESSMALTSATLLTLVDDGTLGLDAPLGDHLDWLGDDVGAVTLRNLLSHTSGLPDALPCPEPDPASCDTALARVELVAAPGEQFRVTDLDAHVAARLAETATGQPWDELFAERLAEPLGLTVTAYAEPADTGGLVAVDGTTTVDDLGRFLTVVRDGGRTEDRQVLSEELLREMLLDQTVRLDTHAEPWVAETGVPTYGLGVWRDRLRGDDAAAVVSAPNRYGLYPFVDLSQSAWGVVVVDDRVNPKAEVVASSALLSQLTTAVLRRTSD